MLVALRRVLSVNLELYIYITVFWRMKSRREGDVRARIVGCSFLSRNLVVSLCGKYLDWNDLYVGTANA